MAAKNDLLQSTDEDLIETIVQQVMANYPDKVEAYRSGNKGLLGLFMGEVMKGTKGKADPKRANEVVRSLLEQERMNPMNRTLLFALGCFLLACTGTGGGRRIDLTH